MKLFRSVWITTIAGIVLVACNLSFIELSRFPTCPEEMVFPRRPTVICVEEDETREFFSFILPLAVLLLVGTVFIMYIMYRTLAVSVCVYVCVCK